MLLPYRENAVVEWAKVRGYYLNEAVRYEPNSKVGLFVDVLGFADPWTLRLVLLHHGRSCPVDSTHPGDYGRTYNVVGPFLGPSGRSVQRMSTSWILPPGSTTPRNTTAFPRPRRRV